MPYNRHKHTNPDGSVIEIWIGEGAKIGEGAEIGDWAVIGREAKIGDWAVIGDHNKTLYPVYLAPLPFGPRGYGVTATEETLSIGRETHSLAEWWAFDDRRILEMNGHGALEYWRRAKPIIFTLLEQVGYWTPPQESKAEAA